MELEFLFSSKGTTKNYDKIKFLTKNKRKLVKSYVKRDMDSLRDNLLDKCDKRAWKFYPIVLSSKLSHADFNIEKYPLL